MSRYYYILLFLIIPLFTGFGDGDAINNNRGNKYFAKGKYNKAINMYDKIKNKANKFVAEYNKGNALIKSGDLKKGLGVLNEVAENGGGDIAYKAYYNMGNALFNAKKFPQAADMYVNSLKLNPNFGDAKYNLEKTLRLIKMNKKRNNNKQKNNNKKKRNKNGNNKEKQNNNKNIKSNQRKNVEENQKRMSKRDAEKILNALMRNRKKMRKDSSAMRKLLNPRYTW